MTQARTHKQMEYVVINALARTADAIAPDLMEAYEDGVLPAEDARESAMDLITSQYILTPEEERFYRDLPYEEKVRLAALAIPYDIC
jgi:hypothetical protein